MFCGMGCTIMYSFRILDFKTSFTFLVICIGKVYAYGTYNILILSLVTVPYCE